MEVEFLGQRSGRPKKCAEINLALIKFVKLHLAYTFVGR